MAAKRNSTRRNESMVSATDRAAAAFFLVYFAPLMIVVALMVKAGSHGPALRCRKARGANGRIIKLWEFRTMAAERAQSGVSSPILAQYTPVGEFLRTSRLDLLPRLFSTLRGDMSFTGLLN